MKGKKVSGSLLLIIGVVLILLGMYVHHRIEEANKFVDTVTSLLPEHSGKGVGGHVHHEINKYGYTVTLLFVAGIISAVIGAILMMLRRKERGK